MFFFDSRGARRCIVALAIVMMSSLSLAGAHAAQLVNTTADGVAMDGTTRSTTSPTRRRRKARPISMPNGMEPLTGFCRRSTATHSPPIPQSMRRNITAGALGRVSEGYAAEVDVINGWLVHDGKLYVNWDRQVRDSLKAELDSRLAKGEQNWPTVQTGLQKGAIDIARHADYPKDNPNIAHPQ